MPPIMFGSRKTTGRDQNAGDGADGGGHAPAERDHPADVLMPTSLPIQAADAAARIARPTRVKRKKM
jgi:hypothetical protein